MINFEYSQPTNIIFGKGTHKQIGMKVAEYAKNILIVYGSERIKKDGLLGEIEQSLKDAGVEYTLLGGVKPNPRLSLVYKGIDICREKNIELVLAVGGGSPIDSAKAIAVGAKYSGDVWDLYLEKDSFEQALPVATILTIAAAGSEASTGSVITNDETGYKRAYNSECVIPVFSILNPELTCSVPKYQTVCGAADIMMHDIERYFTNVQDVDITDRLCEAVLLSVMENAPKAIEAPGDYELRANIMWAGTIAHNNLLSTGRIGDWSSHGMGHEIGAMFDVAHGATLSIMCPAWMKYVYKHDIARFKKFAVRVMGANEEGYTDEEIALQGIENLKKFFASLGLPVSLGEVGVGAESIEKMAEKCTLLGNIGNFVSLDKNDIEKIYNLAL
ncbi:MAG: iron-containing alcohol dehydrogenase [Clostridia bacterium]|nr:iron-containing alcohol dehydrogenase [Clostridia bacterium]